MPNKLAYLEGLRGLAALIVVFNHFTVAFYPALYNANFQQIHTDNALELTIAQNPLNLIYNGHFAVCIFFVLSGYVLTFRFFRDKNPEVLSSNAVRRYFRLVIPIFFSSFLVYLCMKFSLFYNKEAAVISYSDWWLATFWNFETSLWDLLKYSFYDVLASSDSRYNTVLWTMSNEFYGSFLVFAAAAVLGKLKNRTFLYLILLLVTLKTYYFAFVLGLILADFFNSTPRPAGSSGWMRTAANSLLVLGGLFLGSYPTGINVDDTMYGFLKVSFVEPFILYHNLGAFLILLALLQSKKLQAVFSGRFFTFLGRISFSMYLLHIIVIGTFACWMVVQLDGMLDYHTAILITCTLSLILIFLVSILMAKYVDAGSVKLTRLMYEKWFKPGGSASVSESASASALQRQNPAAAEGGSRPLKV